MILAFPVQRIFLMSNLLTADIIKALSEGEGKTLLVCVGNTLRMDDGVGPYIAGRVHSGPELKVIDAGFTPENIIDEAITEAPAKIVVIDAADFRGNPGQVRIVSEEDIPQATLSTHSIPLNVITQIIREKVDCRIFFIGIQPATVTLGEGLTEEVRMSADEIIRVLNNNFPALSR